MKKQNLYITERFEKYPKWKREEIEKCKHAIREYEVSEITGVPYFECEKCNCPFILDSDD